MKEFNSAKNKLAKIFLNINKQNNSNIKKIVKILEQIKQISCTSQEWEDLYFDLETMACENNAEREWSAAVLISIYQWRESNILKCLNWSKKILLSHKNGIGNSQYINNLRKFYAKSDDEKSKRSFARAHTIGELLRDVPVVVFSGEKRNKTEKVCMFCNLSEQNKKSILNSEGYFDWLPRQNQTIKDAETFRVCNKFVVVSFKKTHLRIPNTMLSEIVAKKVST